MSYSIDIDLQDIEEVTNLTVQNFSDEFIIETDSFDYWFDSNIDITDHCDYDENDNPIDLTEEELLTLKLDNVDEFKSSNGMSSIIDDYASKSDSLDILQNTPQDRDIELVTKYCSNISLFEVHNLNVYGISNNGGGMDLSDNYALAYWICDGYSPISVNQVMSLSEEAEKLLRWFEATYKETCRKVDHYQMNKYLRELQA